MTRLSDILPTVRPVTKKRERFLPAGPVVEQEAFSADELEAESLDPDWVAPPQLSLDRSDPLSGPPGRITEDVKRIAERNPGGLFARAIRNETERRQVFVDLWAELRHNQPSPTKRSLAKLLREIAGSQAAIMERDAYVRLAAWAINAAVKKSMELSIWPVPVAGIMTDIKEDLDSPVPNIRDEEAA